MKLFVLESNVEEFAVGDQVSLSSEGVTLNISAWTKNTIQKVVCLPSTHHISFEEKESNTEIIVQGYLPNYPASKNFRRFYLRLGDIKQERKT